MRPDTKGVFRGAIGMVCVALVASVACTGDGGTGPPPAAAEGPPEVRAEVVREHASQFDDDLPKRRAGSQEEFAAATYLTGHLQKAGYTVRLDSVPVADTIRSTNVVAIPPGGDPPAAVVAIPYDNTTGVPPQGEDLGLFLELARALRVVAPEHRVEFVALGAEYAGTEGSHLGSRRLIRLLLDAEHKPPVITPVVVDGGGFNAPGPTGDDLNAVALEAGVARARSFNDPVVPALLEITHLMADADLRHALAAGGIDEVGDVLLDYLASLE